MIRDNFVGLQLQQTDERPGARRRRTEGGGLGEQADVRQQWPEELGGEDLEVPAWEDPGQTDRAGATATDGLLRASTEALRGRKALLLDVQLGTRFTEM